MSLYSKGNYIMRLWLFFLFVFFLLLIGPGVLFICYLMLLILFVFAFLCCLLEVLVCAVCCVTFFCAFNDFNCSGAQDFYGFFTIENEFTLA